MASEDYDLIVIGGGAGGVAAAIRAAQLGARVALIEDKHLGGLCMNRGCIPFGHMMVASRILGSLALAKDMGIECAKVSTNFSTLIHRQDELIKFMRQGVQGLLNKNKISLIAGKGRLAGSCRVEVNGQTLSCKKVIIAAGARWLKPDFPDSDLPEVVNSDYLLTAKHLPESCLLFGSGPMIIEIAQFLHRFGSKVWLATGEDTFLNDEDKMIRSRLTKALQTQGITLLPKTEILGLKKKSKGVEALLKVKGDKEEAISADLVINLRRGSALEWLGLGSVGLDERGDFIKVNERMETDVKGIYAIGDAAAPETRHFSHLASAGGIIAAENAMGLDSRFNQRTIARVAFTQPQVACVGLTGKEAKQAGYEVVEGSAPLAMNGFGMIIAQNEGTIVVVGDRKYGEVLGIHMLGEGAAEMAGHAVLAIQMEATLEELAKAVFPHPTLSESLADAARDALGRAIYLP